MRVKIDLEGDRASLPPTYVAPSIFSEMPVLLSTCVTFHMLSCHAMAVSSSKLLHLLGTMETVIGGLHRNIVCFATMVDMWISFAHLKVS